MRASLVEGKWSTRAGAVLTLVFASVVGIPGPAAMAATTCDGLEATIVGTAGADTLIGTDGNDVIVGSGGDDYIKGKGGHDVICAGSGNDEVNGGPGKDRIFGGAGDDLLWGKGGRDVIEGNAGADDVRGGNGPDDLSGGDGPDTLYGNYKDDVLFGGPDDDIIWGGSENDVAYGGDGTDDCKAEDESGCERDPHDFSIGRFYVTQSVPAADSADSQGERVPTILGRAGLVRVFVLANHAVQGAGPEVVMHWRAGVDSGSIVLDGPNTVPVNQNDSNLSKTFNAALADDFLRLGMEVYVEVDPANEYREHSESNNRWPESGWHSLDVTAMPSFDVTFVPIILNGTSASVSVASAEAMLEETMRIHPIAGSTIEIRAPYAFDGSTQQDWIDLLYELSALRSADGSDRTYYGVLPAPISPGIGGIGFIGYPVALGLDDDHIVAHELGHTLSLNHAPCGGASGSDPGYPYAGGSIGTWGYDIVDGLLRDPDVHKDVMSYCGPSWISDYNYANVVDYRDGYGFGAFYAAPGIGETVMTFGGIIAGAPAAAGPGLTASLYGEDPASGAEIRHIGTAEMSVRTEGGAYRLIGRADDGSVLFSTSFEAYAYADGPGGSERLFMVNVTIDDAAAADVATVEVVHLGAVLDVHPVSAGG